MSMPGSDFRPDDGPYTECAHCGASIRDLGGEPDEEPLCEECEQEQEQVEADADES